MGAIAEGIAAYAQPLLEQTDGSLEEMQKAFAIAQLCYNLALLPADQRDEFLSELRSTGGMSEDEFDEFQRSIVVPMIERHEEMFPFLHTGSTFTWNMDSLPPTRPRAASSGEAYPGTDRYAPCPCDSGEKYKFCCGKKGR